MLKERLSDFFIKSPEPFHTVKTLKEQAEENGFKELFEAERWQVEEGGKYFIIREGSIILIALGTEPLADTGVHILGAHTDSPTYKIRPTPMREANGLQLLNVEPYGGLISSSWFDRDLGVAGRVVLNDGTSRLVHIDKPLCRISHLSAHLSDKEATKYNPQTKSRPIWGTLQDPTLYEVIAEHLDIKEDEILSHDLVLCSYQKPEWGGPNGTFFYSGRQDNLLGTATAAFALYDALGDTPTTTYTRAVVAYDYEEIGSTSRAGAASPFVKDVFHRMSLAQGANPEDIYRIIAKSGLISIDTAHAIHPNYAERYDDMEHPSLGEGPCLKVNANQSYATNALTTAWARSAAKEAGVNLQVFTNRADQRCGSTIGPITATRTGIPTVDIGQPIIGMHSFRELSYLDDAETTTRFLAACLNHENIPS